MGVALKKEMSGLDPASGLASSFVPVFDCSVSPVPGLGDCGGGGSIKKCGVRGELVK